MNPVHIFRRAPPSYSQNNKLETKISRHSRSKYRIRRQRLVLVCYDKTFFYGIVLDFL